MASPKGPAGQHESLYAKRVAVYPKAIDGFYRRLKWAVMILCLAVYYVTPWIRWNRGPYAPDQAVLVDLAHRRFFMFQIEIWPHEFYYVAGLLVMAGIGLFLVTSAVGRAWCGYACPQTVWTDLFQHVERWIDGDRNAQIRLARAPWDGAKVLKRLAKWSIWLVIAVATGGAWIFYFADAPTLANQFIHGDAPWVAYSTVGIMAAVTFIFGGFMREQVCIYMCPWPRIQTAMLDEKSLIVTYKDWRGEPRTHGRKRAGDSKGPVGDCIDCGQCIAVCPTGIDIRNGPQIGCITCALCIDACDKVMAQIGKPRGLIDYCTLDDAAIERTGQPARPLLKTLFRPRTLAYAILWVGIGFAMLFVLTQRTRLDLAAQRDRNPVYVRLSEGGIRNAYTLKIRNMEARPRTVRIAIDTLDGARIWSGESTSATAGREVVVSVPADSVQKLRLFVAAPDDGPTRTEFGITASAAAQADEGAVKDRVTMVFERPEKGQ